MHVLLVIVSILASMMGLALLSPATQGVGVLAFACLLAIFARIAQSGSQRAEDAFKAQQAANAAWQPPSQQQGPSVAQSVQAGQNAMRS